MEEQADSKGQMQFISNIPVSFPFTPYGCQLTYMDRVIQALQQGTNAVLESPTGTGKTLCLLCSTLAWRKELVRMREYEAQRDGGGNTSQGCTMSIPKIIYSSRTHSQLSQAIKELRNTAYKPNVTIIGSREQMCINPEVMQKESNAEKVHLCRAKVHSKTCGYYRNLDVNKLASLTQEVMDVEDLVLLGSKNRMCPYYLARERMTNADMIFMPYNYVLDTKTLQAHGINLENAIVILDEAHNIESVCEDTASFDITSSDIAHCIDDSDYVLRQRMGDLEETTDDDQELKTSLNESIQDAVNMKQMFLTLEKSLDQIKLDSVKGNSTTKPGSFILEFFNAAGINRNTFPLLVEQCEAAISFLTTCGQKVFKSGRHIQSFLDATKTVFARASSNDEIQKTYRVYVTTDLFKQRSESNDPWKTTAGKGKEVRVLRFLCFSPGYTMRALADQGVRSIIITSGTLSPINSFCSELKLEFPIQLQGSHVISPDQVYVGVVKNGPDSGRLSSSYKLRFSEECLTSLGKTLINISRTVPDGLLVFFPSYSNLNSCLEAWTTSGIIQRIEQYKQIFKEPRRKADFNMTMDAYYEKIRDPNTYGAAFFAVCRGKVSEGLDFADAVGRAVVITGIPFAPREDPKVKLKMEYLRDERSALMAARYPGTTNDQLEMVLSQDEWYRQQAVRAVNQAIGRVIRHKNDYGAILLCDERFGIESILNQLSQWLRPHIKVHDKFGPVQKDLTLFFKNASSKYGTKQLIEKSTDSRPLSSVCSKSHSKSIAMRKDHLKSEPSLGILPIPSASLAKLDDTVTSVSKPSFMDSLKHSESKVLQPHHTQDSVNVRKFPSASSSHLNLGSFGQSSSGASHSGGSKKKVVIINTASKVSKPEEFLINLKKNLSEESYSNFKKSFAEYKKSDNFDNFFKDMKTVFNRPALYQLFFCILKFVKQKHVDMFREHYSKFTGTEISSGASRKRTLEESITDNRGNKRQET